MLTSEEDNENKRASAVKEMEGMISALHFRDPATIIVANTTAQPLTTAQAIKDELVRQICGCIQWRRSVEYMVEKGVSTFIEVGPGQVLTGLIKRISKQAKTLNVSDFHEAGD